MMVTDKMEVGSVETDEKKRPSGNRITETASLQQRFNERLQMFQSAEETDGTFAAMEQFGAKNHSPTFESLGECRLLIGLFSVVLN